MIEKALHGSRRYFAWVAFLVALIGIGAFAYLQQFMHGLSTTGMSRSVSWGLYISQFTFLVGIAASGMIVIIFSNIHAFKHFGKLVVLVQFVAVAAVLTALLFIIVDLGQPARLLNMILYPSPNSVMFWDMVGLSGYLFMNILIAWASLNAEKKGFPVPKWAKVLTIISIPWAIGIQMVEAFLYSGLPGRSYWLSAITGARFIASGLVTGSALLVVLCLVLRKISGFKVGERVIDTLAKVACYAMIINIVFLTLEIFTAYYSGIPGHQASLQYMFFGIDGHDNLVVFMWLAVALAFAGLAMLLVPKLRSKKSSLVLALAALFVACWLDKGLGLLLGGFAPNGLGQIIEYVPKLNEIAVIVGVYALGALVLTILIKVMVEVRKYDVDDEPQELMGGSEAL